MPPAPRPVLFGTAGHIDHGKTSLVRALTGFDLDRTPEERDRGITIHLGFAWCDVDDRRLAFVDVPGHERLIRAMVAGVHAIDAALLVVSAVDGVMPQTREHLAILRLLGVTEIVVAVSQIDRADADLVELAVDDTGAALAAFGFTPRATVPVSATTGAGVDDLRRALAAIDPRPPGAGGTFRMPVDRVFSRPGFGAVVTGTVVDGALTTGATAWLHPGGERVRVRTIEAHGTATTSVEAGQRAALNLAGVDTTTLGRGVWVLGHPPEPTSILDLWYEHLEDAPELTGEVAVRVLHGTADLGGRLLVAPPGPLAPGGQAPAQLRLEAPIVCRPGDRVIVRQPSPGRTLGGGVVVDPWAPRLRPRDRIAHGDEIRALYQGDADVWLRRAGAAGLPLTAWRARAGDRPATRIGERAFDAEERRAHAAALDAAVDAAHREQPLEPGANRATLRVGRLRALDDATFDALIAEAVSDGRLREDGPWVAARSFVITLDPAATDALDDARRRIADAGLAGLPPKALAEAVPHPALAALLRIDERAGALRPIPGVGWVTSACVATLVDAVRAHFADAPTLSPGEFKTISGLSRSGAIPWLEWLDRSRYTVRRGDARLPGPALTRDHES